MKWSRFVRIVAHCIWLLFHFAKQEDENLWTIAAGCKVSNTIRSGLIDFPFALYFLYITVDAFQKIGIIILND